MTDIAERIAAIAAEVLKGNQPLADAIAEAVVEELGLEQQSWAGEYWYETQAWSCDD